MNNPRSIRLDTFIIVILLGLIAWMRFAALGSDPLSDTEAVHALTAAASTPDSSPFWESANMAAPVSPSYYVFTTLLFQLMGASDAAARLIPAIAGIVLVMSPLILRNRIGTARSLITVLVLAVSTSAWTIARSAGGSALAAASLAVFVFLAWSSKPEDPKKVRLQLAAGAFGFALASGTTALQGIFGLLLATGLSFLLISWDKKPFDEFRRLYSMRSGFWITLGVMILVASGMGLYWSGLSGLGETLAEWLRGWTIPGEQSAAAFLVMLASYEPLVLGIGLVGAFLAWRKKDGFYQATSIWALGSLFAGLIYPDRSGADLIFVVLPLALLVSYTIAILVERVAQRGVGLELIGLVGVLLVLAASAWISVIGYTKGYILEVSPSDPGLILLVISALIIMAVSLLLFFGLGWSWDIVADALGISVMIVLAAFTLSAAWRLNFQASIYGARELWRPVVTTRGMRVLNDTLDYASLAYAGRADEISVEVQSEVDPALAWALRGYNQSGGEFDVQFDPSPAILVKETDASKDLRADYMGQGIAIIQRRAWEGILPPKLLPYLVLRSAPTELEHWILWVRMDIATLGDEGFVEFE